MVIPCACGLFLYALRNTNTKRIPLHLVEALRNEVEEPLEEPQEVQPMEVPIEEPQEDEFEDEPMDKEAKEEPMFEEPLEIEDSDVEPMEEDE